MSVNHSYGHKSVVVLVGTTGSGKSTVGNLLVDIQAARKCSPDEENQLSQTEISKLEIFNTGYEAMACTQSVQSSIVSDDPNIIVVDTPGFDESMKADARNTVNLLKKLAEFGSISTVAFCQSEKAQNNFESILSYVGKIFTKKILENNFIILCTKRSTSAWSMGLYTQEKRYKDMQRIQCKAKEVLGTEKIAPGFLIDSLPPKHSDEQWERTIVTRSSILTTIREMKPVNVHNLQFHKHPYHIDTDAVECVKIENKLRVLTDEIRDLEKKQIYLKDLQIKTYITKDKLISARSRLHTLDTSEQVQTGYNCGYGNGRDVLVYVTASHPISTCRVDLMDYEDSYSINYLSSKQVRVRMSPYSSIFGRTGGRVYCSSEKRVVEAHTISYLKSIIDYYNDEINAAEKDIGNLSTLHNRIVTAKKNKDSMENKISILSRNYLTIDEAVKCKYY